MIVRGATKRLFTGLVDAALECTTETCELQYSLWNNHRNGKEQWKCNTPNPTKKAGGLTVEVHHPQRSVASQHLGQPFASHDLARAEGPLAWSWVGGLPPEAKRPLLPPPPSPGGGVRGHLVDCWRCPGHTAAVVRIARSIPQTLSHITRTDHQGGGGHCQIAQHTWNFGAAVGLSRGLSVFVRF